MAGGMIPVQEKASCFKAVSEAYDIRENVFVPDRRTHKRGGKLFIEGDRATHLVHLQEGLVKLVKHSREGKDVIVEICGPGAVMGVTSLLDGDSYDATAIVMAPAVTLWEPLARAVARVTRTPKILQEMIRSLSARLRESHVILQSLVVDRVDTRIATLLVKLAEGSTGSAGYSPEIPLTRQEMADVVGSTTETTIRVVSRLIREGAVQGRNRKLIVTDMRYLKDLAAGVTRRCEKRHG